MSFHFDGYVVFALYFYLFVMIYFCRFSLELELQYDSLHAYRAEQKFEKHDKFAANFSLSKNSE